MKKSPILAALILGLAGAIASAPAFADSVLYDNTTSNSYGPDGATYLCPNQITDSFTLSGPAVVDAATFPIWVRSGDSVASVSWEITSQPFGGSTLAAGDATSLPNTPVFPDYHSSEFDILQESVSIPDLTLGPGTYWFEISDLTSKIYSAGYWDNSFGTSTAYQNNPSNAIQSESFQILGATDAAIPEPSSFLLLASGLAGLAGMVRRKLLR